MKKLIVGATALLTTLTGAMASAPSAEAAGWRGGGYHGGYGYRGGYGYHDYGYRGGAGPAVVAGIAGLAVGAALADHHGHRPPRYDYGYGYEYAYGPGYEPGPAYYGYYGCHREWVWGRWGGYHLVEVCD